MIAFIADFFDILGGAEQNDSVLYNHLNTKTKILPVVIKGLYKIKPRNRWNIKTGLATMIIDKPIEVANKSIDQLIEETRKVFLKHNL